MAIRRPLRALIADMRVLRSIHGIADVVWLGDEGLKMPVNAHSSHVVISGCSGGGKSTLLEELRKRGFETVKEPGRRIVLEEKINGGRALPWVNLGAFAHRAIEMASIDRNRVQHLDGWVFFDRGLVDAALALEYAQGIPAEDTLKRFSRYHPMVFLTPPWAEIYLQDGERQHSFDEGAEEYERLLTGYRKLGYAPIILPKTDVETRADLVLDRLGILGPSPS